METILGKAFGRHVGGRKPDVVLWDGAESLRLLVSMPVRNLSVHLKVKTAWGILE